MTNDAPKSQRVREPDPIEQIDEDAMSDYFALHPASKLDEAADRRELMVKYQDKGVYGLHLFAQDLGAGVIKPEELSICLVHVYRADGILAKDVRAQLLEMAHNQEFSTEAIDPKILEALGLAKMLVPALA